MIVTTTLKVLNWTDFFFTTVNSTAIFIHFEYFTFKKSKVYNKATMYFEIHHVLKIAHFHTAHGYLNFCTWSEIQRAMENYNLSEAMQHTIASSSSPLLLQQHLGCHAYVQDPYHILGHVFMAHWSFPSNIQISHSFLSCMCREGERMVVQDRRCLDMDIAGTAIIFNIVLTILPPFLPCR